jgi:biopolymer transport protein ExbB/TolQ
MRSQFSGEFLYQLFALLISFIIVHAAYVAVIRPTANAFLAEQHTRMKSDAKYVPEQSIYVILRDYEQEATFVLMFWAFAILALKGVAAHRHQRQLDWDFIGLPDRVRISPDHAAAIAQRIRDEVPVRAQSYPVLKILLSAIDRFTATGSIQDASAVVHSLSDAEAERADSELSIIRYIAWAIPSIGFIGTVRGIGDALAQAQQAVAGDITGVTESLGVAFNSTLIALLISIALMFVIHQVQLSQERVVLATRLYCERGLINRLKV